MFSFPKIAYLQKRAMNYNQLITNAKKLKILPFGHSWEKAVRELSPLQEQGKLRELSGGKQQLGLMQNNELLQDRAIQRFEARPVEWNQFDVKNMPTSYGGIRKDLQAYAKQKSGYQQREVKQLQQLLTKDQEAFDAEGRYLPFVEFVKRKQILEKKIKNTYNSTHPNAHEVRYNLDDQDTELNREFYKYIQQNMLNDPQIRVLSDKLNVDYAEWANRPSYIHGRISSNPDTIMEQSRQIANNIAFRKQVIEEALRNNKINLENTMINDRVLMGRRGSVKAINDPLFTEEMAHLQIAGDKHIHPPKNLQDNFSVAAHEVPEYRRLNVANPYNSAPSGYDEFTTFITKNPEKFYEFPTFMSGDMGTFLSHYKDIGMPDVGPWHRIFNPQTGVQGAFRFNRNDPLKHDLIFFQHEPSLEQYEQMRRFGERWNPFLHQQWEERFPKVPSRYKEFEAKVRELQKQSSVMNVGLTKLAWLYRAA